MNTKKEKSVTDMVRQMASLMEETGLAEIEYGEDKDGWHVRLAHGSTAQTSVAPAPPAPASVVAATKEKTAPNEDFSTHPGAVTSPMVGIVYVSKDENSPPFITVGTTVKEGDTLLLIEAMKVFSPIKAPRNGKITHILVSNAIAVEYGEPLVIIE